MKDIGFNATGNGKQGQPKYERDMLRFFFFFMKFTLAAEKMDDDTEYTDTRQGILRAAVAQHRQEGWENVGLLQGSSLKKASLFNS